MTERIHDSFTSDREHFVMRNGIENSDRIFQDHNERSLGTLLEIRRYALQFDCEIQPARRSRSQILNAVPSFYEQPVCAVKSVIQDSLSGLSRRKQLDSRSQAKHEPMKAL